MREVYNGTPRLAPLSALMRFLMLLALAGCAQPVEEPCRLTLTEREVSSGVETGRTILSVVSAECGAGACIRDGTVPPGDPDDVALGYCARGARAAASPAPGAWR